MTVYDDLASRYGQGQIRQPSWRAISRDCTLNRETATGVAQAGFLITHVRRYLLGIVQSIEAIR
ncbi:MAG: hypothetical protein GX601_16605 [Anaerolineales bacterium]|nr:hypothetical protein [Anaerolineales bacterium]